MAKIRLPASKPLRVLVIIGGVLVLCMCSIVGAALVSKPGTDGTVTATVQASTSSTSAEARVASKSSAPTAASAARSGAVALPTPRGRPSAEASSCDCSRNLYNCDDFPADGWDAQACDERCKQAVGKDVHDLDRDSDGAACEWEW